MSKSTNPQKNFNNTDDNNIKRKTINTRNTNGIRIGACSCGENGKKDGNGIAVGTQAVAKLNAFLHESA